MVDHQTETSALQNKDDSVFRPLYSDGKEAAAAHTLVNLAEEAKLTNAEVNAPGQTIFSVCKSLIAGGVAGGVSRSAVAPLERLKILLQVQNPLNPKYNGMVQGLHHIWHTEGIRGFFKGNGTNCARIVPNSAVKFYSYEQASSAILWLYRRQTGNGLTIYGEAYALSKKLYRCQKGRFVTTNGLMDMRAPHFSYTSICDWFFHNLGGFDFRWTWKTFFSSE